MFNKLKQFGALRQQAKQMQNTLSAETAAGTAGFGKVKIVINGTQEVLDVQIDVSLLAPNEKKHLQDLVKDAVNDAIKKLQRILAEKMKGMKDLDLAALMGK